MSAQRMHHYHTYRLSDGVIVGSCGSSHSQPLLEAPSGCGVVEHDSPVDYDWDRVIDGRVVDTSDAKFAADLEAKWQHLLRWHPLLAHAVPPAPLQRRSGTFRLKCAVVWQDFADRAQRGDWRLRGARRGRCASSCAIRRAEKRASASMRSISR